MTLDRISGAVLHATVGDLPRLLEPGDLLVVNDTRVFAARLLGHRVPSGGAVECLLLGPSAEVGDDTPGSFTTTVGSSDSTVRLNPEAGLYDALVHPGQKLKPGARMKFEGDGGVLMGEILARSFHGRRRVRLWVEIGRDDRRGDRSRSATSRFRPTSSAPTASPIASGIRPCSRARADRSRRRRRDCTSRRSCSSDSRRAASSARRSRCTSATARSSRCASNDVEDHVVDPERYQIGAARRTAIARARAERPPRDRRRHDDDPRARGCRALRGGGVVGRAPAAATLFIYPGFDFRVIDGLLTNFHLPAVVAADAGRRVRRPRARARRVPSRRSRSATASTATAMRC